MRGPYRRRRTASRGRYWIASLLMLSAQSGSAQGPVVLAPLPLQPLEGRAAAGSLPNPFCATPEVAVTGLTDISTDDGRGPQHPPRALVKRVGVNMPTQIDAAKAEQTRGYSVSLAWTKPTPVEIAREFSSQLGDAAEDPQLSEGTSALGAPGSSSETQSAQADDSPDFVFSDAVQTAIAEEDLAIPHASAEPVVGVAIAPQFEDLQPEPSKRAWKGEAPVISISDLPEPVLTRVPISNRIIPVPVPVPVDATSTDSEPTTTESRDLDYAERRIINGVRPRVDVSKPPVAVERFARFGAGWPTSSPAQPNELLVKAISSVQPVTTASGHLTDSLSQRPELEEAAAGGVASATPPLSQSDTDFASQTAEAATHDASAAESVQVIGQIRLRPSEARSIKLAGNIRKIESDLPATCTAFLTKAGQIQVIATGTGSAMLTVELTEAENITRKVAYEVEVEETATSNARSLDMMAKKLTEAIRLAFPQTNAHLRSHAGRLEIIGQCPDDETAKQILRMVRSACPVAINDRLNVR